MFFSSVYSHPEVSNLDIVVFIEQNVFRLQITMTNIIVMHELYSFQDLLAKSASLWLSITFFFCNESKEITSLCNLKNNEIKFF